MIITWIFKKIISRRYWEDPNVIMTLEMMIEVDPEIDLALMMKGKEKSKLSDNGYVGFLL